MDAKVKIEMEDGIYLALRKMGLDERVEFITRRSEKIDAARANAGLQAENEDLSTKQKKGWISVLDEYDVEQEVLATEYKRVTGKELNRGK